MLSPKQLGSSHGRLVILSAWNWLVSTINLLVDHLYIWTSMLNSMMIFITIGRRVAHFTLRLYCNIIWTIQTEPRGELVLNILFRGRPKHLLRSRAPKAMSNCRSMRWSFVDFRRRSFFGVGLDGLRGVFSVSVEVQKHPIHFECFIFLCTKLCYRKKRAMVDTLKRLWFANRLFIYKWFKIEFESRKVTSLRVDQIKLYCAQQEAPLRFYAAKLPHQLPVPVVHYVPFSLREGSGRGKSCRERDTPLPKTKLPRRSY